MVKHKRYSDKPKEDSTRKDEKTEFQEQEISSEKTSFDLKSILLSGIFTPLTLGIEIENVIFGMLSILLGFAGGVIIFLGIKSQKFTTLMVSCGSGMMFGSLILIYESTNNQLFN